MLRISRQARRTIITASSARFSARHIVRLDLSTPLQPQLENKPRDAERLRLDNSFDDTPSKADWDLLREHFPAVKNLYVESGFEEDLKDRHIPLQWPLEKLTLSNASGEVCSSPWIVEGKIKHLVLYYTSGLRFDGPTNEELVSEENEAISRGEKKQQMIGGVKLTFIPGLAYEWMRKKYANNDGYVNNEEHAQPKESNMKILEIVQNDVRDTFFQLVLTRPHLLSSVETLSLVVPDKCDLWYGPDNTLEQILPQLAGLKTLVLVLSDYYPNREQLPNFFRAFPPNIHTLRFRSSVSLAERDVFQKWLDAFRDPAFLPSLRVLSFVLDLEDGEEHRSDLAAKGDTTSGFYRNPQKVPDYTLAQAKEACDQLWHAAENRGVKVEPFVGEWAESFTGVEPPDDRWEHI